MGMNDFSIGLIAGLDGTKSKQQLNQDIEALKRQLGSVEIQAKLDSNTITNLTKQLNSVQINLQNVFIDQTAINNMVSQINTALSGININLGNALNNNVGQAAQNVGRQAGNIISGEVENSLRNVTSKEIGLSFKVDETDSDEFNNAVDKEIRKLQQAKNKMVSVNYTTDTKQSVNELTGEYEHVEKLTGAVFRYNTETGEAITKTMKWAQIGTTVDDKGNDVPLMGWVQGLTRYSKALDESKVKVDNFAKIQKTATANLNNQINQLNASALDKNADRPITESGHLTQLESKYNEVKNAITTMGNASRDTFTDEQINVKELISQYKILVSEFRNAENVRSTFKSDKLTEGISKAQSQFKALQAEISSSGVMASDKLTNEVSNITKLFGSDNGASMTKAQVEQVFTSLSNAKNELNALVKMNVSESSIKILSTQANTLLEQINNFEKNNPQFSNFSKTIDGVDVSVDKLKTDLQSVNSASDLRLIKSQFANLQTSFKATSTTANGLATDISRLSKAESWQKWLDNNTKATKKYGKEIKELIDKMKNLDEQMTKSESNDLTAKMKGIQISARNSGLLGNTTIDKLKTAWQKFGGWSIATGSLMGAVNQIKQIPKAVYEIDTAMTDLYKVTDETNSKYEDFLKNAKSTAKELGRDVSSTINQTAEWAKLGYNIDDSAELAKNSSIYSNVGEVDDSTAVSDMVTAMKAFNIEAKNSIQIVDKLNILGNEFATSSADLGTGLKNSASALALAGNDINKTLAMLTGGTEITQNASEMGNTLKVLSMRIRGMKGKLEELGEDSDGVESISKIQTQILNLTKGQVNIFDDSGNFKDTYDILEKIAKVWKEISETDQASLLEIIAGKQRGNQVAALIQSFQSGQAQKAYQESLNSAGSAQKEQDRWMESAEAKIQQLEAAWQSLSDTVLSSDFLKGTVDTGTSALGILDKITEKLGGIPTLLTAISGVLSSQNIGKYTLACILSKYCCFEYAHLTQDYDQELGRLGSVNL